MPKDHHSHRADHILTCADRIVDNQIRDGNNLSLEAIVREVMAVEYSEYLIEAIEPGDRIAVQDYLDSRPYLRRVALSASPAWERRSVKGE